MRPTPANTHTTEHRRRFAIRLSLFYGATFAIAGAYMPFFPLWLAAKGLNAASIGIVMAVPTIARVIAVPLVTRSAERKGTISQAIFATALLTVVGFALLAFMTDVIAIAVMLLLTACVWAPTVPLTDAYALRGVAVHGVEYGPVRLWGSVAYIGGVLAAGLLASAIAAGHLIWIIVAIAGISALAGLRLEPIEKRRRIAEQTPVASLLLWQPAFLTVLAAAALIQGSHAAYYTFSSIAWEAEGHGSAAIAVLWSLCVVAEIILFAVSPRLDTAYSTLIIIGGFGAAVRWGVTALEPSIGLLAVVQMMHALSFCATHLGTMGLLSRLVPHHSIASAQGHLTAAVGLVTAMASMLCGRLFGAYGQSIYFGMAMMAMAGGLLMLAMRRRVDTTAASGAIDL